jgi:superfamily II DNA or RNA helicase/diadenosine tetraphosphate (Ap4A) HIT family hydrolase
MASIWNLDHTILAEFYKAAPYAGALMSELSPFEEIAPERWVGTNETAFAIRDSFPVSPGHTLVITKRRIATWWEATESERHDILALVDFVKARLDAELQPDGYNVGFNAGEAAGQTVSHLHFHIIPRYAGDVPDPAGGVRHVLPGGNYLAGAVLVDNRRQTVAEVIRHCLSDLRFDSADLMVSFVMRSGLQLIGADLEDALERGLHIRLLTTDYLQTTEPDALARLLDLTETYDEAIQVRVFSDPVTSFHPKGYLFWSSETGVAVSLVGSSNLSRSGIQDGYEWNLASGPAPQLVPEFEALWDHPLARPLTHEWLRAYKARPPRRLRIEEQAEAEIDLTPPEPLPMPWPTQEEALVALKGSHQAGHGRGLVVLATGLGKTWLAAFYVREVDPRRVLFVAHRDEILRQSRDVFRKVMPGCDAGMFTGDERVPDSNFLFASVQSFGRNLYRWEPEDFDVVIIDEFHHAAAPTYRTIIEHFRPDFLLGLTATPDRLDGADLLALCGDNLVFECGVAEGIKRGELCPFRYWAEKDVADFAHIPWRNGRFDPEELSREVETIERAQQEFDVWQQRRGHRTLGFCCSVTHADFMADFFTERGVRAKPVHSGPTSAARRFALQQLAAGEIDIIFSVDLFNEGVDVPEVDTVLMLRPTDSPVVFLQQLGRGLRISPGKEHLTVIDFIGNHRSFLVKPRTLLSLAGDGSSSTSKVLAAMQTGDFGLPEGCSVRYDLEAVDLLRELTRREQGPALVRFVRAYVAEHSQRPTAVQAWRAGFNPASMRPLGWFGGLADLDVLEAAERSVVDRLGDLLRALERESITKSYKLVTLEAFLDLGGLAEGVPLTELADRSRYIMRNNPRLAIDAGDHLDDDDQTWYQYWRQWPLAAWPGELRESGATALFEVAGDRLRLRQQVPADTEPVLKQLAGELVDYRLCRYLDMTESKSGEWRLRVSQSEGRPLIWLNRERSRGLPEGETDLIIEGQHHVGLFRKIALNKVYQPPSDENVLPAILRRWFGPEAGAPGTAQNVALAYADGKWELLMPTEQPGAT